MSMSPSYAREIQALDFFSGLGVMSYGLIEEGLGVSLGLEIDPNRTRLYKLNLGVNADQVDLSIATRKSISSLLKSESLIPDVVVGCPPCQSFSFLHRLKHMTFFVAAAIEDAMAREIWDQLRKGTMANAANLTKDEQIVQLCKWLQNI